MSLSSDVCLPKTTRPKFPNRCIVCSGEKPDAKMGVGDLAIGWFSFFTDIPEGWGSVVVPVHTKCRHPFRLRRWGTRLAYLVIAALLWWLLGDYVVAVLPEGLRRIGSKLALLLMLAPVVLIELFNPPRFDITVRKHDVTFLFADINYASSFAKLNNSKLLD